MIVVAIIGLLAAIAIPSFQRSRQQTRLNTCINNMRLIDNAGEQWAMAENAEEGEAIDEAAAGEYIRRPPVCPDNGTYTWGTVGGDDVSCDFHGNLSDLRD
jgi:type II secretory pathway pseudopilin PulG